MKRTANPVRGRVLSEMARVTHTRAVHRQTRGSYGRPRLLRALRNQRIPVGKQRRHRRMQEYALHAKGKRRFKVTTDSRHHLPIAPNGLDRRFAVGEPDKVWAGDITAIAPDEGGLFLAVVIDLFSRQLVGKSMRPQ